MNEEYYAHVREDEGTEERQTLKEHCESTARYSMEALSEIGLGNTAYLAGILHDMGKFSDEFQRYLIDSVGKKGSVIHTFQAVQFINENYHKSDDFYRNFTAELIMYATGAHHGLFDCVSEERDNGFDHRIEANTGNKNQCVKRFTEICCTKQEIDCFFNKSVYEVIAVSDKIRTLLNDVDDNEIANTEMTFYISLLTRLLLSAVIEGDRRDTAQFTNCFSYEEILQNKKPNWDEILKRVESEINKLPSTKKIDILRGKISNTCRKFAEN
jgi:CRISPR-associated endonuclease/helicase Cas3